MCGKRTPKATPFSSGEVRYIHGQKLPTIFRGAHMCLVPALDRFHPALVVPGWGFAGLAESKPNGTWPNTGSPVGTGLIDQNWTKIGEKVKRPRFGMV